MTNYKLVMQGLNTHFFTLKEPIFKTGRTKAILKFLAILGNILKGKNLTTVPQCYTITKNLLSGEYL